MSFPIKDSSGSPSWTLTFCLMVAVIYTPIALTLIVVVDDVDTKKILGTWLERAWTMTVGAFIARDVTKKVGVIVENIKNKKKR